MRRNPALILKLPGLTSQLRYPATLPLRHPLQFLRTSLLPPSSYLPPPSQRTDPVLPTPVLQCSSFPPLCLGWPLRGEQETLEKHHKVPQGCDSQNGEGDPPVSSSNRWSSVT